MMIGGWIKEIRQCHAARSDIITPSRKLNFEKILFEHAEILQEIFWINISEIDKKNTEWRIYLIKIILRLLHDTSVQFM